MERKRVLGRYNEALFGNFNKRQVTIGEGRKFKPRYKCECETEDD